MPLLRCTRLHLAAPVLAVLLLAACGGGGPAQVDGLPAPRLEEIAREAYPLWDPAGIELVSMELLRGHLTAPDRYALDIRYTVRKVRPDEPMPVDQWVARRRARMQPVLATAPPEVTAAFNRQEATTVQSVKRVAAMPLGGTATFEDTLVLVRSNGEWGPQAWVDNALIQEAMREGAQPL